MALESTTYIDGLVATNPTGTDARSQGDDHIRLVKSAVKVTFPNITGAVTATHTELNTIDGYTGTTAELNYNDVPTLGTVEASKTVTADAVGTTTNLKTKKQTEIVNAVGTVSSSTAINFALGNVVTAILASGGAFTISNAPSSGIYGKFKCSYFSFTLLKPKVIVCRPTVIWTSMGCIMTNENTIGSVLGSIQSIQSQPQPSLFN